MALSLLVNIDSFPEEHHIGTVELSENVSDREIRIVLKGESSKDVFGKIKDISHNNPVQITKLEVLQNKIGSKVDGSRRWVKNDGKLSYEESLVRKNNQVVRKPKDVLNESRHSNNSVQRLIFKGYYEYVKEVAIERVLKERVSQIEIERSFRILRELDLNENLIRYFTVEDDADFVYIATELCLCSVEDLFGPIVKEGVPREEILLALTPKGILLQATRGLNYLHVCGSVHRNIKPSNFLVKDVTTSKGAVLGYVVKITDFRLSRPLEDGAEHSGATASAGWEAPESRRKNHPLHPSLDVFILGCFFNYVLTGAKEGDGPYHPFGKSETARPNNISDKNFVVYGNDWQPKIDDQTAVALIKKMIQYDWEKRVSLSDVLDDSYFKVSNEDYYPINTFKKPGLCCIFNQEHFGNVLKYRTGSSEDCERLRNTFKKLGFGNDDIIVHKDLKWFDFKKEMKVLAAKDYKDYGSLVVCFLSHGIENAIATSDSRFLNLNKLKYKFSLRKCPSLYGKPKIFIVQACQGPLMQTDAGLIPIGLPISHEEIIPQIHEESTVHLSFPTADNKLIRYYLNSFLNLNVSPDMRPQLLDFITIKSTLPGFVSSRNSFYGSYFIRALCQKLDNVTSTSENVDLLKIFIGDDCVESILNELIPEELPRQTILLETCLTKHIQFRRNRNLISE